MHPLHELSLADLRRRTSMKWRLHDPDVIPMFVAEMDVPLAEPVARALRDAVDLGDTGYPVGRVYAEALASFAADRWGWSDLDPARTAAVADVMVGIEEVLRLLDASGAPVVVNPPVYPPFFDAVRHVGRPLVEVPLGGDGRLDLEALAEAFARHSTPDRPATYLLCSPHNPTSTIHTSDELAAVVRLADEHGVRVVVDEIHAPLAGDAFVPYLSLPGTDDAFAVLSASKAFNLAGAKAAVVVAGGPTSAAELATLPEIVSHGPSHLGTLAHVAALTEGRDWLDALRADLDANRDLLVSTLARDLPQVGVLAGPGSYLAWLDLRALDLGHDPAAHLLEQARVALGVGPEFGGTSRAGDGFARIAYATPPAVLTEALERIGSALAKRA